MIKKILSVLALVLGVVGFAQAENSSEIFQKECKEAVYQEMNRMVGEYLQWLEEISEQRNLVSEDVLPLVLGKSDLEEEDPGMLAELRMDLNLICYNLKSEEVELDACNWNNYSSDNENQTSAQDVELVWNYCRELSESTIRDVEDFTELELLRDAYEEKVYFMIKKYRHILENLKVLNDEFRQVKYYVTSLAERVKCLSQNCIDK